MKLNFKNRIALFNTIAVALTAFIAFVIIYFVVSYSSYKHLDDDIKAEKRIVIRNLKLEDDSIILFKIPEWEENEHKQMEVNPTFIQIVNSNGIQLFKSDNLQKNQLSYNLKNNKTTYKNAIIDHQKIRQGQFPIINATNKIIGQVIIGISQEESFYVLHNLFLVLCFAYVVLLSILFIIMYFVASKAISPIHQLITGASKINDSNISVRLPLPENKDEIHQLAGTINELLNRLEFSIQQQKQFIIDASHEMRTPVTAIKGTLEVLLRKKRTAEQYEIKINEVLTQTDRLSSLFDQLLQLARLESDNSIAKKEGIFLKEKIEKIIQLHVSISNLNKNKILNNIPSDCKVSANDLLLERILDNLILNAIKYNKPYGNIFCDWNSVSNSLIIRDGGIGISKEQLPFLFNRFYRADNSRSSEIQGNGLGLSIVKNLCDLQNIKITVESEEGKGTVFFLQFPA